MITEDYCDFETAQLLKEKGFDEEVLAVYIYDNLFVKGENKIVNTANVPIIPAPTLQMAMKWLREVHHHIIEIHYGNVGSQWEPEIQWWWTLENEQGEFLDGNIVDGNTTYEKTCNAAVKFCLENLI